MRLISVSLAVFVLALLAPGRLHAAQRPNVLLICADDHAPYIMGAYGNKKVRTPNLDRLATEGIRFDRAYCNSPVCTASRQSFLTGRYPRTIGVTQLRTPLPESEVTLAEMLRDAGYRTAAIGKMHFNSNLQHGFEYRVDQADHRQFLKSRPARRLPEGIEVLPQWRPFRDPAHIWLNGFYRPYGAYDEDMPGTWFAHKAVEYLNQQEDDRPFFLMISFYEPHSPFRFPVEYRDRHNPKSFDGPNVGREDQEQIPAIFRDLTDPEKQGILASYYTSVEFLDKNVGRVLDALSRSPHAENTLVVYLGDHGYMLGQHGRFEKHCSFEPAVRSPLVMRFAGRIRAGSNTDALVEFVDLVPTVLELCELDVPPQVQGKSLVPLLDGSTAKHRDFVVVEYSENEEAMISDGRYKLVYITGKRHRQDGYETGLPLPGRTVWLFDRVRDSAETKNLAEVNFYSDRVDRMTRQLADRMIRTAREPEKVPRTDDVHAVLDYCLQPRDVGTSEGN